MLKTREEWKQVIEMALDDSIDESKRLPILMFLIDAYLGEDNEYEVDLDEIE